MESTPPPPAPTPSRIAFTIGAVLFLLFFALVGAAVVESLVLPLWSQGRLPAGWTAGSATLLVVLSLAVLGLFGASLYRQLTTQLGDEGVSVVTIKGRRRIAWADFQRASGRGFRIRLHAGNEVVTVNPLCYSRPGEVVPYLLSKLPSRVLGHVSAN
jgi:hypothetical protein